MPAFASSRAIRAFSRAWARVSDFLSWIGRSTSIMPVIAAPNPKSCRRPLCWTRSTQDLDPLGFTRRYNPSPSAWRPGLACSIFLTVSKNSSHVHAHNVVWQVADFKSRSWTKIQFNWLFSGDFYGRWWTSTDPKNGGDGGIRTLGTGIPRTAV